MPRHPPYALNSLTIKKSSTCRVYNVLPVHLSSYAIVKDQNEQIVCERTGGGERVRTDDLLLARQALSQLSYTPDKSGGPGRTRTSDLTIISRVL
jgi:hypothetical protein